MRAPVVLLALFTCGALAACTSFDSIERNVCGNGLVEPGEDCDSSEASCVRCAVTCQTVADCPTDAYTCGTDGVCAAPSGELDDPVPVGAFIADDVTITDVDRDGIGDVVGVSSTSIVVRYGEPSARLTRTESRTTPAHAVAPAFGDLDGNGLPDFAISIADGIAAFGSPVGELSPLPVRGTFLDKDGAPLDLRGLRQLTRTQLAGLVRDPAMDVAAVGVVELAGDSGLDLPCGARLGLVKYAEIEQDSLDVYAVSANDVVLSLVANIQAGRKLCVMAGHRTANVWKFVDITPTTTFAPQRRAVFADIENDNDACPALITADNGAGAMREWDGSMTAADGCTLTSSPMGTAIAEPAGGPNSFVVGRVPLSPGVFGFARDMLVTSDGIYVYYQPSTTFYPLYAPGRRLRGASSTDIDGDGEIDGILLPETEDDVDVLVRRGSILSPGYVVQHVDTDSRVLDATYGDFDGNGLVDIAVVEQLASGQRLIVSYQGAEGFAEPQHIASFPEVLGIASAALPSGEDEAGITDDLLVLQPPVSASGASSFSIIFGTVQRAMTPAVDPRDDVDPDGFLAQLSNKAGYPISSLAIGRFGLASAPDIRDLVTFNVDVANKRPSDPTFPPKAWLLPGTVSGPDGTVTAPIATQGLADCGRGRGTGLCIDDAITASWPVSDTRDAVIAIDHASPAHAAVISPTPTLVSAASSSVLSAALSTGKPARSIQAADLDGDGTPEMIVTATEGGEGVILVCHMDGATPTDCQDLIAPIASAAADADIVIDGCSDATPMRITARDRTSSKTASLDLVAACFSGDTTALFRVNIGATTSVSLLRRTPGRVTAVRAGDVTGDGIADLLALTGESGVQSLVVFPQCASRDAATCGGGL